MIDLSRSPLLIEGICDDRRRNKPWRTPSGPKKFAVCATDGENSNTPKLVRFGDPDLEIRRDNPARRKSFRARHGCDTKGPGPRTKARYWACKTWERDRTVGDVVEHDASPPQDLEAVRRNIMAAHNLRSLDLRHRPDLRLIELDRIDVAPEHRGKGHARRAMNDLTAHADATQQTIALTPSSNWGASRPQLTQWYKSHGFVPNKGRARNWATRATLVREPSQTSE